MSCTNLSQSIPERNPSLRGFMVFGALINGVKCSLQFVVSIGCVLPCHFPVPGYSKQMMKRFSTYIDTQVVIILNTSPSLIYIYCHNSANSYCVHEVWPLYGETGTRWVEVGRDLIQEKLRPVTWEFNQEHGMSNTLRSSDKYIHI